MVGGGLFLLPKTDRRPHRYEIVSGFGWVLVGKRSGLRISEIVNLTPGQIEKRKGGYSLHVVGKGASESREAPLGKEAYEASMAYGASCGVWLDIHGLWGPGQPRPAHQPHPPGQRVGTGETLCQGRGAAWRQTARFPPFRRHNHRQRQSTPGTKGTQSQGHQHNLQALCPGRIGDWIDGWVILDRKTHRLTNLASHP